MGVAPRRPAPPKPDTPHPDASPVQFNGFNKSAIAHPFANAQPRPEVLRAKRAKRAKGQPGQSDAQIRLRANEQRSVRDFARFARNRFGDGDADLCSFARKANAQQDGG